MSKHEESSQNDWADIKREGEETRQNSKRCYEI